MRLLRSLSALCALLALSAPSFASVDHHADQEAAIRAVIMDYFEGGNEGDSARVASSFETGVGDLFMRRTDEDGQNSIAAMNLGEFAQVFERNTVIEREGEILDIRIADDTMAFVHFSFTTSTRQFDDFFILYLVNDEWKIVAKAAVAEALEE